jgi:hypothetical protein
MDHWLIPIVCGGDDEQIGWMMSRDQDWRLRLDLDESTDLDGLLSRVRDRPEDLEGKARAVLSDDVVLTHDGDTFFAYAANEKAIDNARDAIKWVLRDERRSGAIRVSHWDEDLRAWRQIDPPLTPAQEEQLQQANAVDSGRATAPDAESETRTVMSVTGKLIRKSFERQMLAFAQELGLQCVIVEHPHLLTTQVAFNLTGPSNGVDQFDQYLKSEAKATIKLDPGLIPYGPP